MQFAKKEKPPKRRTPTTRIKEKSILEKAFEANMNKRKERKESEEFRLRDESNVEAIDL